jgi:DNA topoisomerase II
MGGSDAASCRYIHTELNKICNCIFPQEDMPLLDYVEDDGLFVEPNYYVPILPMVLVNGMTGIGTGFSTNIPRFNPEDICKNIKQILSGKEFMDMDPWFKGFKGSIVKTGDKTYMSKGKYKILDALTMEITELPIGRWTEDYKSILDKLTIERGDKSSKGIILDYENQSTDKTVYFKVHLKPGYLSTAQWSESDIDRIEKDFKLTTTKYTSLTNIHLYNSNNTITKYNTIEEIIREYCKVRLNLYEKRKIYQLDKLENSIKVISAKCKFILSIIEGSIIIQKRTKQDIQKQLEDGKYHLINDTYDYLIKLPIYTLSQEEIDRLQTEKEKLESEHHILNDTTKEQLWLSELNDFSKMYKKFIK